MMQNIYSTTRTEKEDGAVLGYIKTHSVPGMPHQTWVCEDTIDPRHYDRVNKFKKKKKKKKIAIQDQVLTTKMTLNPYFHLLRKHQTFVSRRCITVATNSLSKKVILARCTTKHKEKKELASAEDHDLVIYKRFY